MPQITKPFPQAISSHDPRWVIKNNGPHVWISPRHQSQIPIIQMESTYSQKASTSFESSLDELHCYSGFS
jgi:hypothetical protein